MSDKVKKVFIVIFVVIIIGLFSINLLLQEISINKKYDMAYKEAKELYDRKQYKKSLKTIKNKCKSFKNCDELRSKINNELYSVGEKYLIDLKYEKAITELEICNSSNCDKLLLDSKYQYAISLIESDENKAKELFEKLGDYKDSKKYMLKIMNCWFEILKD